MQQYHIYMPDVNKPHMWFVCDKHDTHMRGGTRVTKALLECLPDAQMMTLPNAHIRYQLLEEYVRSYLPRLRHLKDDQHMVCTQYPPPFPGQYVYVHCPSTRRMVESEMTYIEGAQAEAGFAPQHGPIRRRLKRYLVVSLRHGMQSRHADSTKFLVNSAWGSRIINDEIPRAKNVVTVYPPCNIPHTDDTILPREARKTDVVSIGAITPYKRHHAAIEMCAKTELAKRVVVIGFAFSQYPEAPYLEMLRGMTSAKNKRGRRFTIETSYGDAKVYESMYDAKCVISAHWQEHFGIAVVEAIARGCIPVVPDAMGFKETVPFEELRFTNDTEAPRIIDGVLGGSYDDLVPKLRAHVSQFSYTAFHAAIKRHVLNK